MFSIEFGSGALPSGHSRHFADQHKRDYNRQASL